MSFLNLGVCLLYKEHLILILGNGLYELEQRRLLNYIDWFERDTYLEMWSYSHKHLIEVCIDPCNSSWLAPGVMD